MITDHCQRSTERRITWRPSGETIQASAYDAVSISPTAAIAFVRTHHYAGESSPPSHTFGLYQRGALAGVAVFSPLPSMNAHRKVFGDLDPDRAFGLGRFVLVDSVPGNGESWFIARCFAMLRDRGVIGIESCADPLRGHVGTIYQATNGRYVGRTNPSMRYYLDDGTEVSGRAASKTRTGERGGGRSVRQLVAAGAQPPEAGADMKAWFARWRPLLTRKLHHPGNHRYVWCLDRRMRRSVLAAPEQAYPKIDR